MSARPERGGGRGTPRTGGLMVAGAARLRVLLAALALASCGVPRDPGGTLERVRGGTLRVGTIAHPPWVVPTGGAPQGVEVQIVRDFARELGATVRWVPGPEAELMEALERSDLDLVIGGVLSSSPWAGRVALTRPYRGTRAPAGNGERHHVMAVPPGENGWLVRLERFLRARRSAEAP